jgi:hypothetical protein
MIAALDAMSQLMGRRARLLGGVITHWNDDAPSQNAYVRLVSQIEVHSGQMLTSRIPFSSALESKPQYARNAVNAYERLTEEVIQLCQ